MEVFGVNMENIVGNRGGIVYSTATQVNAGSSSENAVYSLPNHTFRFLGQAGLIVVSIPQAATSVQGISIQVNDQKLTATDNDGDNLTNVSAGDHLLSFNKTNNTIKFFV